MWPTVVMVAVVIPVPGTNSTSTDVLSLSTLCPALLRPLEKAIEEPAAGAPASSSSGLVLACARSARLAHVTGNSLIASLATLTRPFPLGRSPSQTASARLTAAMAQPPQILMSCNRLDRSLKRGNQPGPAGV